MRYPEPALLHRLPDNIGFDEAALVEPTANVVTDVLERGHVEAADTVAVVGPGPIGLLAAMAAKAGGAAAVILIGTDADEEVRLPAARKIKSIDCILNVQREDVVKLTFDMTQGRGADLVVEASGAARGIDLAVQLLRKLGRLTAIGLTGKPEISFPYDGAMFKAATCIFNLSTSYTSWDKAIRLISSGRIETGPLITHRGGLDRWEEFFASLEAKKGIKGIFIPDQQ
jgi:L-iditol 2-dehydrogenase